MQIGVRMGHIPASRRTVTMALGRRRGRHRRHRRHRRHYAFHCDAVRMRHGTEHEPSNGFRLGRQTSRLIFAGLCDAAARPGLRNGPRAESDTAQGRDKRQNKSVRLQGRMEPIHHVRPRQGLSEADTENLLQRHPAAAGRRTSFR